MVLKYQDKKDFFVNTAYEILSAIGYKYSRDEVREMCEKSEDYLLYFKPIKHSRLHIGIWAVGKWEYTKSNPQTETDSYYKSDEIDGHYGVSEYQDYSICVFCVHDWDFDKFRPTYSHWQRMLTFGADDFQGEKITTINELNKMIHNRISTYYDIVDFDNVSLHHQSEHKYKIYYTAFWNHEIKPRFQKAWQKTASLFSIITVLLYIKLFVGYHKLEYDKKDGKYDDRWWYLRVMLNPAKSDYDNYLRYKRILKLCEKHIDVAISYYDSSKSEKDLLRSFQRGVFWSEAPDERED